MMFNFAALNQTEKYLTSKEKGDLLQDSSQLNTVNGDFYFDFSTEYLYSERVVQRINELTTDIKVVIISFIY